MAPEFADSLSQGFVVPPSSSVTIPVIFSPRSDGLQRGRAVVLRASPGDTASIVQLSGEGRAIDFDWISRDFYPTREIRAGEQVQIGLEMADSVEVDSVLVWYAEAGSRSYRDLRLTRSLDDPVNDRYAGSIPGQVAGARGIEFFFAAYNGSVAITKASATSPEAMNVRLGNLACPIQFKPLTYRMFSIPLEMPNNTATAVLEDDLGAADPTRWRLFGQPRAGRDSCGYIEHTPDNSLRFRVGEGYWLITKNGASLDTAPLEGLTVATDSAFSETLVCEWNMIGNPFNFSIRWDSVRVNGGLFSEQSLVEQPQWYDGSSYVAKSVLEPFGAYWVKRSGAVPVVLQFPPVECRDCATSGEPPGGMASWAFGFRIEAASMDVIDRNNDLGLSDVSAIEWDRNDMSEAPRPPGRALSLYFPHSDWGEKSGRYTRDVRTTGGHGETWAFDVAKNFSEDRKGDDVVLRIFALREMSAGMQLHLIDRSLRRDLDLRSSNSYSFLSRARDFVNEGECRFLLVVGGEAYWSGVAREHVAIPPVTRLLGVSNPMPGSVVIRYELARSEDVRIRLFDVRGSMVRDYPSRRSTPGIYELKWEGRDSSGHRVASGVYFLKLSAGSQAWTKKIALVR